MFDVQCSFSMGYITTTASFKNIILTPTEKPNKWTHSVIFEPQPQIQLTCSSYKVTSFLDFQPFLQGFQNVKTYLDQLWIDIQDLYHFQYLFLPIAWVPIDLTISNSHIERFLKSTLCVKHPYKC